MPSVVVVDGNADLRFLISLLLQLDGCATVVGDAPDGDTALAVVERTRPDIVVMDATKSSLSGLDATRRIKERWPATKVVLMTRPTDAPVRDKAPDRRRRAHRQDGGRHRSPAGARRKREPPDACRLLRVPAAVARA